MRNAVGNESFCSVFLFCIFSVFWSLFCVHSVLLIMRCLHSLNMHFVTDSQQQNGTETQYHLELVRHRGHQKDMYGNDCRPDNLLQSGGAAYYSQEPARNDWIVFQIKGNDEFIPMDIRIVNRKSDKGIKEIKIMCSQDEKEPFDEWLTINGIEQEQNGEQRFPINPKTASIFHQNKYNYLKLVVVNNYGAKYNIFSEFKMFGINGVFTVYSYTFSVSPSPSFRSPFCFHSFSDDPNICALYIFSSEKTNDSKCIFSIFSKFLFWWFLRLLLSEETFKKMQKEKVEREQKEREEAERLQREMMEKERADKLRGEQEEEKRAEKLQREKEAKEKRQKAVREAEEQLKKMKKEEMERAEKVRREKEERERQWKERQDAILATEMQRIRQQMERMEKDSKSKSGLSFICTQWILYCMRR